MKTIHMLYLLNWIEREFPFPLSVGSFPSILARLRGTPDRLEALAMTLTQDELTQKPRKGWSIQEHIGHLLDLELLHIGRVDDFVSGKSVLRSADLTNRMTDSKGHNKKPIDDLLRAFIERRNMLVDIFTQIDGRTHELGILHPRLACNMKPVDLAYFVAEHDDHHIAKIWELKS